MDLAGGLGPADGDFSQDGDGFHLMLNWNHKNPLLFLVRTNKSYYLNFPAAIAEALGAKKGEEFEWEIDDKNTLVLRRVASLPPRPRPSGAGKKAAE